MNRAWKMAQLVMPLAHISLMTCLSLRTHTHQGGRSQSRLHNVVLISTCLPRHTHVRTYTETLQNNKREEGRTRSCAASSLVLHTDLTQHSRFHPQSSSGVHTPASHWLAGNKADCATNRISVKGLRFGNIFPYRHQTKVIARSS